MAGTKTFAVFETDLTFELGQRSDISAYVGDWINVAYMTLTTQNRFWGTRFDFEFPELETVDASQSTGDGVPYLDTPATALIVRTVFDDTNKQKLDNISWLEYASFTDRDTAASENKPTDWVRSGTRIYLHPTPDAAYSMSIYHRARPTALTGTGVTAIGPEWDEPILQLAVIQSHMRLGQFPEAKAKKEAWLDMMAGMVGIYTQEKIDREDIRKPSYYYIDNKY